MEMEREGLLEKLPFGRYLDPEFDRLPNHSDKACCV